jgi:peptidoglycan/xylan/chitin deacetylase (PgdA/CDA1 family)
MSHSTTKLRVAALAAVVSAVAACAAPARAQDCPGNPDAIGTSRVITIDPGQYQRLGTLNYPETLPLQDHEVVLTFDDGPLPPHTTNVLNVLASQCVKALFFLVGEMAHAYPDVAKRIHADGHTIGSHSQDHPLRFDRISEDKVRWEIDTGIENVSAALGEAGGLSPFFRIPGFGRTDYVESEAAARNLVVFSTDVTADDWFRRIGPSQVVTRAIQRLEAKGKGMLLLHDIHPWTAVALPILLKQLKEHGFHIVQVVPSETVPPVIAARAGWTVAWSMADQNIMDDGSAGPSWPIKPADNSIGETADLPAPDEGAFDPNYALAHATVRATNAAADSASVEAGIGTTPWPYQVAIALPLAGALLPAPSLADIGWPVKEQPALERQAVAAIEADATDEAKRAAHAESSRHPEAYRGRFIIRHARARPAAGQHASLFSTVADVRTSAH